MRKWPVSLILLVLAGLWAVAPAITPAVAQDSTPAAADVSAECRSAVEGMAALTADLPWPKHLMQENAVKTEDDFDVNEYFTVLDHLAVEGDRVLDYVYRYDFMGGYPVLYTRPADQAPFATVADYSAAVVDEASDYRDWIRIDDTPEGYMQMVILGVMGRQFYLHWHAAYNDFQIICDSGMLRTLLASDDGFGQPIPKDVQKEARRLDVTPTVELDEDVARVRIVGFTKWGGFFEVTYTISRDFPRDVYDSEEIELVPFNCGVMF
jgi:hypothetical protein